MIDVTSGEDCCRPLLALIKGHVVSIQIKAALAVEVLADHNESSQAAFLAQDAVNALIRLLKVQTDSVVISLI